LGNLIGERYSIGGDQWDVSRKSLRELQAIVRDFTVCGCREARATGRRFAPLTNIASDAADAKILPMELRIGGG